jgi:hypothetical protein
MSNFGEKTERRIVADRRLRPTSFMSRYPYSFGRRKGVRREADRKKYIFVDVYSTQLWVALMCLMILSLADTYLTLKVISMGIAVEANPIMAFYLSFGDESFVAMKFFLTAGPLIFFCVCKDSFIAKFSLVSIIMIYVSVVIYEFTIILS